MKKQLLTGKSLARRILITGLSFLLVFSGTSAVFAADDAAAPETEIQEDIIEDSELMDESDTEETVGETLPEEAEVLAAESDEEDHTGQRWVVDEEAHYETEVYYVTVCNACGLAIPNEEFDIKEFMVHMKNNGCYNGYHIEARYNNIWVEEKGHWEDIVETVDPYFVDAYLETDSFTYTGSKIEPIDSVVVIGNDGTTEKTLEAGEDYSLLFRNNINAGTASVTINGVGKYYGLSLSRTFTITPVDLSKVAAATIKNPTLSYTGKERTQSGSTVVKATLDGETRTLKWKTDYTISYSNNVSIGTATMTIKGIGNYTGKLTKTFEITPAKLSSVTLAHSSFVYNGKKRTQTKSTVVTAKVGVEYVALKNGTDYKISYTNNTNVGTATMTITGKGNYTGTLTKTFKIVPKATKISTAKSKKAGKITVKWAAQKTQTTGYQVQFANNKEFTLNKTTKTVKSNATLTKTYSKFASCWTYYVRVRTYKTVNGKKYYSAWSKAKEVVVI